LFGLLNSVVRVPDSTWDGFLMARAKGVRIVPEPNRSSDNAPSHGGRNEEASGNADRARIKWMFTTEKARQKLRRVYPVKES
jgi:hypothetical protein